MFYLQHVGSTYGSVSLVATYPRRELSPDLDSCSMLELELAPSGIVMVTSGGRSVSRAGIVVVFSWSVEVFVAMLS